jgi:hypothetical protein
MSAFIKAEKNMVFNIITARISYLFSALRCSSKMRVPILTTLFNTQQWPFLPPLLVIRLESSFRAFSLI